MRKTDATPKSFSQNHAAPVIRIYTLGALQVVRHERTVSEGDWHTRQARQLLKILVTERPRAVSTDRLIELLWPHSTPAAAATTLRSAINALRNVLEPDRPSRTPSRYIVTESPGYAFRMRPDLWLDVVEFEEMLDAAERTANLNQRLIFLEQALAHYEDDYLMSDPYADWAQSERERLRERYFSALLQFAEIQAALGNFNAALTACRTILARDEVRENAYQALMRYQAEAGDSAGALLTYERCRTILAEELGADPSPLTQHWHERILNGEVQPRAIAPTAAAAPPPSTLAGAGPDATRPTSPLPHQSVLPSLGRPFDDRFVGRPAELTLLQTRLRNALAGAGNLVLLEGETGIGKTHLAYQTLRSAAAHATVLSMACRPLERRLPFAPLADGLSRYLHSLPADLLRSLPAGQLAQVAQIIPSLPDRLPELPTLPSEPVFRTDEQRQRLVDAIVALFSTLAQRSPLALFIDDLHWADPDTLAVLSRLAPRLAELPIWLLLAYRSDDLGENEPLVTLLHTLKRDRFHQVVSLGRLTLGDVQELAAQITGQLDEQSQTLARLLYEAAGGNALFVSEALRDWEERYPDPAAMPEPATALPSPPNPRVQEVITERIERLPNPARALLQLGAVVGRDFSLELLEAATTDDPAPGLETLLQRKFLVERPDERIEFSHQVIRQVAYEGMTTLQRRRLHQRVADALITLGRAQDNPAEIAFHFGQAGAGSRPQFALYTLMAGEKLLRTYAFREAVAAFDQALALLAALPTAPAEQFGRALLGRGLAYEGLFDPEGVTETYRRLHAWAQAQGDEQLMLTAYSRLTSMLGLLGQQRESNELLRTFIDALTKAGSPTVPSRLMLDLHERRRLLYSPDPPGDEAAWASYTPPPPAVAEPVADVLRVLDRAHAVLPLLDYGWTLLVQGQLGEATHCLEAVVDLAQETGQPSIASTAYHQLAVTARILGHWEQSHALNEQSIAIQREMLGASGELGSLWPRIGSAFLALKQGRLDEAERRLQQALALLDQRPAFRNHRNSAQIGLGLVALGRGDLSAAQELLAGALTDAVNLYPYTHVQALLGLAQLAAQRGEDAEAAALLRRALRFAGRRSLLEEYMDALLLMAALRPAGAPVKPLLHAMHTYVQKLGLTAAANRLGERM
ncbi:MAG: AAA family ATPase [Caldilineaceae bacterium]|nr:AAA family ATPase [Caldilineaceae bacterium]